MCTFCWILQYRAHGPLNNPQNAVLVSCRRVQQLRRLTPANFGLPLTASSSGYMEDEILARLAKLELLTANLTTLKASVVDNSKTLSTLPGSVDTFYLITCGALIFFMQARVRARV